MKNLIILGAAGLAKEFYYYALRANPDLSDVVFVNDLPDNQVEINIDGKIFPVVKDWKFKTESTFIVAVGSPKIKKILVEKALNIGLKPNKTIIDPSAIVLCNNIGLGGVISPNCVVTSNVNIGNYVTLNLNCTVGHDTSIGDYTTTNPGVHISGECVIGDMNEFGTGCIVKDRLKIGSGNTFGAQCAVVKNIEESAVYVGIPAKKLIRNN